MTKKWYVIHTQTGHEEKIKINIERRAKENELQDSIAQILIPTEKVAEVRGGKKNISFRKFFPGYVLLEMDLTDRLWYLIKNTPGVTGFIGPKEKPQALKESEIKSILKQTAEKREKATPKVIFQKGEGVRVTVGPFTNFNGIVDEVNPNKGKLKVTVSIFGRATPVELEYWQVEKV